MSARRWRLLLGVVMAATMVAIFCLNYFHGGTSIGQRFSKQSEVDRVNDAAALDHADALLFGDASHEVDLEASIEERGDTEAGFRRTQQIRAYDKRVLLALTMLSVLVLVPCLYRSKWAALVYLTLALYLFLIAYFKSLNGGAAYSELAVFAQGTRWLAALALALWLWQGNSGSAERRLADSAPSRLVVGMLVVSVSITFMCHGAEAFLLHPGFVDLLMSGSENLFIPLSEGVSHSLLKLIGLMDITLALVILSQKNRKMLLWMAFWGALAALSRPLAHGSPFWIESLLRIGNFAIPLILAFIYCPTKKKHLSVEVKNEESHTVDEVSNLIKR